MTFFTSRALTSLDAEAFRELRLETLRHHGKIFEKILLAQEAKPLSDWAEECTETPDRCWFGLFADGRLVGLQGTCIWAESEPLKPEAFWMGNFVRPAFRGQGAMKELYKMRLEWARDHHCINAVGYLLDNRPRALSIFKKLGAVYAFTRNMSDDAEKIINGYFYKIPLFSPPALTMRSLHMPSKPMRGQNQGAIAFIA